MGPMRMPIGLAMGMCTGQSRCAVAVCKWPGIMHMARQPPKRPQAQGLCWLTRAARAGPPPTAAPYRKAGIVGNFRFWPPRTPRS